VGVGGTAHHHEIRAVEDVRTGRSDRHYRDLFVSASPSAMASAAFLVLPNIDS
jgi:hypothetical protein